MEATLKECIVSLPYDTLSNFVNFSIQYETNKEEYCSLREFFRDYDPPMLPGRFSCVGLSLDLITKLSAYECSYPGLKDAMYQISCEETIDHVDSYCASSGPPLYVCEKEHVLVCIRVVIEGRPGVLLMDPGYHIAVPITVMVDGRYPQTPEFLARRKGLKQKVYRYEFHSNPAFIVWNIKEFKADQLVTEEYALIHTTRPFLSAVDIAERRNLIYPFKSFLVRSEDGTLLSGFYFPVRSLDATRVLFFYVDEDGERKEMKIPLGYFQDKQDKSLKFSDKFKYENFLKYQERKFLFKWNVRQWLSTVATFLGDVQFFGQFVNLNDDIVNISKDN